DLTRRGLNRERVAVGPAAPAEIQDRLARAVARQLGLRAVRVEDPQPRDVSALVRLRQQQDPVRPDSRVGAAEQPNALRRELEREVCRLDDDVVVAERLPLLESHERGILAGALALTAADPAT